MGTRDKFIVGLVRRTVKMHERFNDEQFAFLMNILSELSEEREMEEFRPGVIASRVRCQLEECMNDLADGDEALAEDNWNDSGVLGDMLGDRISDELVPFKFRGKEQQVAVKAVAKAMKECAHHALSVACDKIIER